MKYKKEYQNYTWYSIFLRSNGSSEIISNEYFIRNNFFGDEYNALSEDGNFNGIQAKEYEVFEIKF